MVTYKGAFFILLVLYAVNTVTCTTVRSCSGIDPPLNVDIKGCTTPPCELPQNVDAVMEVTWRVPRFSNKISPKVWATVAGITTPYPLDSDGCKDLLNGACPVSQDEVLLYNFVMPMSTSFPQVNVDIEFHLVGDDNKALTCFKVAAKVVGPR